VPHTPHPYYQKLYLLHLSFFPPLVNQYFTMGFQLKHRVGRSRYRGKQQHPPIAEKNY